MCHSDAYGSNIMRYHIVSIVPDTSLSTVFYSVIPILACSPMPVNVKGTYWHFELRMFLLITRKCGNGENDSVFVIWLTKIIYCPAQIEQNVNTENAFIVVKKKP